MKAAAKKSEHMTSLSGTRLVPKTHGRIVFRGLIDSLQAEVIKAQVTAASPGNGVNCNGTADSAEAEICGSLGEILDCLRALMSAEVRETPLPPPFLFGMDAEELHRQSHNTEKIFGASLLPSYTQGPLAAKLNTLRAKTREAEIVAVKVFGPPQSSIAGNQAVTNQTGDIPIDGDESGSHSRDDIILALNRLSSAFWWLYCKYVSTKNTLQGSDKSGRE